MNSYRYAFLSRSRRFGKSLFLDTLKNIFKGKKELFKGLYIYDKCDWDTKYPVIKID
ncbi:AAA family ATPase [Peptococcaceae bacterium]|nr:AAA family ATPase [Peptococcaceae bacterium]